MKIGKNLSKVLDVLGEILAVLTIAFAAFLYLDGTLNFLTDDNLVSLLWTIREYMILGTIIIVGLEFAVKRSFAFFVIFVVLAAVAVIFSFFPDAIPPFLAQS
ncbi:MAG: hypothetical protein GX304_04105 [Clostridiales bacterium]|jgi:hypothetical protein|nr:hypothetical protein [Clostridiales bacterium]